MSSTANSDSSSSSSTTTKVITLQNASQCSPYELRQELLRRNAFDLDPETANYRTMLQRLVIELVREEEAAQQERARELERQREEERERVKREREARKAEALARSAQRRAADPEYFQRRQALPEPVQEVNNSSAEPLVQEVEREGESEADGEERERETVDPFRAYKPSGRNRVFVK